MSIPRRLGKETEDNSAMIGQVAGNVATNITNISTNATNISTNATNISTNSTAITNLKTNFNKAHKIGVANKDWLNLTLTGSSDPAKQVRQGMTSYNVGATDTNWRFELGNLPYQITDLDGNTKNLYITQTKVGIYDAAEGDEIDRCRWQTWSAYDTVADTLDTGAGIDEDTPSDYTWDHADTQIGGVYTKIHLLVGVIVTNAGGLDTGYALVEYYYG